MTNSEVFSNFSSETILWSSVYDVAEGAKELAIQQFEITSAEYSKSHTPAKIIGVHEKDNKGVVYGYLVDPTENVKVKYPYMRLEK